MTKRLPGCMAGVFAIFAVFLSATANAEKMSDTGVIHLTRSKQEVVPSPFNNGETLTLSQSSGKYEAADKNNPLDGADSVVVDFSEVKNGNGTSHVWNALTKDGSISYTKTVANIKTTKGADGKPVTTVTGTYEKIGGTGKFANLKGSGTFTRKAISPTSYDVDVNGVMDLGK